MIFARDLSLLTLSFGFRISDTALSKVLKVFHSVSLLLQKKEGHISHLDVRVLFDKLIDDYGDDFEYYLASNANIVNNTKFESSIVQYLHDDTLLTQDERKELEPFEFSLSIDGSDDNDSDAENLSDGDYGVDILRRHHKRQRVEKKYIDIAEIPVTSNIVERFSVRSS